MHIVSHSIIINTINYIEHYLSNKYKLNLI